MPITQILRVMKLTAILLTVACVHLMAAVGAQTISYSGKNVTLKEIFTAVKKQTGYLVVYNANQISSAQGVTVDVKDQPLTQFLNTVLKGKGLDYTIENKTIVVSPQKKEAIPITQGLNPGLNNVAQPPSVHGRITNEKGEPVPGVNISLKGGRTIGVTDDNGEFVLNNVDNNATLVFSAVSIETFETKLNGRTELALIVKVKVSELQEVVINKGYYTTKQKLNTGNVVTVKGADIEKSPVADPMVALAGRVPGLFIYQSSGGVPNAAPTVNIRGQNSIANGNNPLYIVDGVPYTSTTLTIGLFGGAAGNLSPFSNLPINDIEEIQVLKDADATAIYGSRGANGVILITTKRGKSGDTKVDVKLTNGFGKVPKHLDLMNTQEYLAVRKKALLNDGIATPGSADVDLNGDWGDVNQYTDWQKVLVGGTAGLTEAQLSVSGGNERTQFLYGGSYRRESTVFPGDFRDTRASGHFNLNHTSANTRFVSNVTLSYVNDINYLPSQDVTQYIFNAPNTPILYTPDGKLNFQNSKWTNSLFYLTYGPKSITDNFNVGLDAKYKLYKQLEIGVRGGYNDVRVSSSLQTTYIDYDPNVVIQPSNRTHAFGSNRIKTWIIEPTLTNRWEIGLHKINVLVGGTFQQNKQDGTYQTASGFVSPSLVPNIRAAATITMGTYIDNIYRYSAAFGRISYEWNDQLAVNLTGRRDGSSRFGPSNRFANLGAAGASWVFTQNKWVAKHASFLSFGKARASYGITGNDQLADFQYMSTYSSSATTYQGINGLNPSGIANPNFSWETVKKLEFGLELGFLNDRLFAELSWYRNRTGNQLVGYALPDVTGFSTVQANLPAVVQNTGLELAITSRTIQSKDLKWTTSFNISIPRNKLVSYPNFAASSYANRYVIGMPLSIRMLYQYTGLNSKGEHTVQDKDGNGVISSPQDTYAYFAGRDFFGGMNNTIRYKQFQLEFLFQFVKQTGYSTQYPVPPGIFSIVRNNQLRSISESRTGAYTQSFSSAAYRSYSLFNNSDYVLQDASFVRLRNISISWEAPASLATKIRARSLRVFAEGQNLFTISGYNGYDPEKASSETTSGTSLITLPALRMIVAGIQVTF